MTIPTPSVELTVRSWDQSAPEGTSDPAEFDPTCLKHGITSSSLVFDTLFVIFPQVVLCNTKQTNPT